VLAGWATISPWVCGGSELVGAIFVIHTRDAARACTWRTEDFFVRRSIHRAIHAGCAPDRHRSPRGMLHREDQISQLPESTSCRSHLAKANVTASCSPNHERAALQLALTRDDSRSGQQLHRPPVNPLSSVGSVKHLSCFGSATKGGGTDRKLHSAIAESLRPYPT
jgi:hypothetical protein